jgi:FkbM family methyltransferase
MKCAIITPVGPGHAGLYRDSCLPSIQAAEAHSKGPFQEIVPLMMDDTQALHGRSARRNDALQQALQAGIEWVFFLDADDLLSPMAFEAFGRVIEAHPDLEGVWGLICEIDENGEAQLRESQAPEIDSYAELLGTRPVNAIQIGCFVRTEVAARYGFDVEMNTGEDYKFYYQVWRSHRCRKLPEIFFMNRRGQHSTGARSATGRDWVHVTNNLWEEHVKECPGETRILHEGRWARMRLTNPYDIIQAHHVEGRFFEDESLDYLKGLLKDLPALRIAEVGANIGNHVVYYGQHLNAERIYPVEPNPAAIALLRENIALNGLEGLIDDRGIGFGVGREAGRYKAVSENPANLGATSLVAHPEGDLQVVSLDELFSGERIDFMKIDVEGMEFEALAGAERLIAESRPIIWIELLKANVVQFMRSWLPAHSYRVVHTKHYNHTTDFFVAPK